MAFRFVLLLTLFSGSVYCQTNQAGKLSVTFLFEDLYSTHDNHFTGASCQINRTITKNLKLGAGAEYAHAPLHRDNGWNLYDLQFMPIFVSETYSFNAGKRFYPFLHAELGISFNRYKKEFQNNPGYIFPVHEKGFYGYVGGGIISKLNRKLDLAAEAGFKGFHISTNDLDVNPHGLTGKLGFEWSFQKENKIL